MAKHQMRHWVSLAGKAIGLVVVASPAIKAVWTDATGGYPQNIPQDIVYNYTGFQPADGSFNSQQLITGAMTLASGLVLMKVFSYIARRF